MVGMQCAHKLLLAAVLSFASVSNVTAQGQGTDRRTRPFRGQGPRGRRVDARIVGIAREIDLAPSRKPAGAAASPTFRVTARH